MRELPSDLQNIPVLRILIPYILGIVTAIKQDEGGPWLNLIILLVILLSIIWFFFSFRRSWTRQLFFIFFFLAGLLTHNLTTRPVPDFKNSEKVVVLGRMHSKPVLKNGKYRFEIQSKTILSGHDTFLAKTSLITYMEVDKFAGQNAPEEFCAYSGKVYRIRNNGNPGEFDYAGFMARQNCYFRFYPDSIIHYNAGPNTRIEIRHMAMRIKDRIIARWDGPQEELAILMAIVLGDKSEITSDTRQNYSDAGAMHILAVSGLHIGLIWLVLRKILFFLTWIPGGKGTRTVLVILLLWFYAFMSGLTPSVCRSVTMFSLLSFSSFLSRRGSSLNIVLLSGLILLIINPQQLSEVGFQLSYLAVIGIIVIQPFLSSLITSRFKMLNRVIDLSAVSIAAQLATAPLSVYYFHQLPIFFLLTNLLAIPLLSCIVGLFIISTPFFLMEFFEEPFIWILVKLSGLMNHLMEIISGIPGSTISGISLSAFEVILILLFLSSVVLVLKYRGILFALSGLALLSIFLFFSSFMLFRERTNRSVVVNHFNRGTMVSFFQGRTSNHFIAFRDSLTAVFMTNYIESAFSGRDRPSNIYNLDSICEWPDTIPGNKRDTFNNSYNIAASNLFRGCWLIGRECFRVLIINNSSGSGLFEKLKEFPVDLIILHDFYNPDNLEMLDLYADAKIIVDGSNGPGKVAILEERIPYAYITDREGAYIKSY